MDTSQGYPETLTQGTRGRARLRLGLGQAKARLGLGLGGGARLGQAGLG